MPVEVVGPQYAARAHDDRHQNLVDQVGWADPPRSQAIGRCPVQSCRRDRLKVMVGARARVGRSDRGKPKTEASVVRIAKRAAEATRAYIILLARFRSLSDPLASRSLLFGAESTSRRPAVPTLNGGSLSRFDVA